MSVPTSTPRAERSEARETIFGSFDGMGSMLDVVATCAILIGFQAITVDLSLAAA